MLIQLFHCTMPISGFSTKKLYFADGINSRTLSSASISVGPVLTRQGIDVLDSSNYDKISKLIISKRPDLMLIPFNQIQKHLYLDIGKEQSDSLFIRLYNDNTLKLQLYNSLWKFLPCDFFMIIRIRDAMSIKTFNNMHKKRLRLEAELWNCKSQETVWRIEVAGIYDGKRYTDKEILSEGIEKIYAELPITAPSYENCNW